MAFCSYITGVDLKGGGGGGGVMVMHGQDKGEGAGSFFPWRKRLTFTANNKGTIILCYLEVNINVRNSHAGCRKLFSMA